MTEKLDALIAEAKADREPRAVRDLDWGAIEARVAQRIEEQPSGGLDLGAAERRRRRVVRGATLAIAVAATTIIYARRRAAEPEPTASAPASTLAAPPPAAAARREASSFTSGALHVGGSVAQPGFAIHEGDALSVTSGRAVFERAGAVSWLIEPDDEGAARARVTAAGKPLVVRLEHGAIEAQVTPVKEGEAFAVDIATLNGVVRVAVHGTHLRVARAGDRVVVDLSEGVIAIGVPPKEGLTTGTSVTAPAHVELDARDLGSIRVDASPAALRAPVPLGERAIAAAAAPPATPTAPPSPHEATAKAEAPKSRTPAQAPARATAREAIVTAVRRCATRHATSSGAVRVTITSELTLTIAPTGEVKLAQFSPPLPPAVQSCAAEAIYKTRFDGDATAATGTLIVPLQFTYE